MIQRLNIVLITALMLGDLSSAQAVADLRQPQSIDIPAEPLPKALKDLGWQINVAIICASDLCRGIKAPRVFGTLTVDGALQLLLRGSGLHYEFLEPGSIGIFPDTDHWAAVKPRQEPKGTPPTSGNNPADTEKSTAEVIITGSNIPRAPDGASPARTYSRRDLEESGYGSLEEFLSRLPQNLNTNSRATYAIGDGQNGPRGSSVNFLGLGEQGTLVLINGHRVAKSAMGNFVDVSLIPWAAVDQIEVLSDGAAAIYGADAVAGVVNIKLRREFNGAELDVRNAWPDHSGADELSVAPTVGTGWGSGNLVASATFHRDKALRSIERSYSDTAGYELTPGVTSYEGYLFAHQDLSSGFSVDIDGLYSYGHTVDDANYALNGNRVGPYQQSGVTNQYSVAPVLKWTLNSGWHAVADFDVSANRFTEMTAYGADAVSGAAVYSTLSEARVRTVDGRVDGPVAHLRDSDAKLALGYGERWEDYHSTGSSIGAFAAGSFNRRVGAAYAELYLPAAGLLPVLPGVRKLDFTLALRAERYSDAGFTRNPKLEILWQPVEHLSIRGSYGTSFATARFSDTLLAYNALIIQRTTSPACDSGSCLVAEEFGARPTYRPERSKSYTVGFDWAAKHPAGLQVRANLYSIDYRDQISAPPDADTLLTYTSAFAGVVVPNPTPAYLSGVFARAATYPQGILNLAGPYEPNEIEFYLDERTRNFARTLATGIDFDLGYNFSSEYGAWNLGLSGTRVLKLDNQASPVASDVSVVNTFAHPLSRRFQARVGLRTSVAAIELLANYLGPYVNNQVTPSEAVASWTTLDATLTVPLGRILSAVDGRARLQLSIENLLNRDPPHVQTPLVPDGYDPVLANALGRIIALRFLARLGG